MRTLLVPLLALTCYAQGTGSVEGTVVNAADGRPIGGATVLLQGLDASGEPPLPDSYLTRTGPDGRYRVEGVIPGHYEARPQRDGFTAQPPGIAPAKVYMRFQVEAGQCASVVSRLLALGIISGRVMDPDGDPISGVRVEALRYAYTEGKRELQTIGAAGSDDRGRYRISSLPPARYYLRASKMMNAVGIKTAYLKIRGAKPVESYAMTYYPGSGDAAKALPVDVGAGGEAGDVNIQILPAGTYAIHATLSATETLSAQAYFATTTPAGAGSGTLTIGGGMRPGYRFDYPNATPGTYIVSAADPVKGLFAAQAVEVVNADVEVTLNLAAELVVNGTVRVEGSSPILLDSVMPTLEADLPHFNTTALPARDGSFSLRRLQPLSYRLRVKCPAGSYVKSVKLGDAVLSTPLIDIAGAPGAMTITLATDGGRVAGVVLDSTGGAVDGASVVLAPDGPLREWADLARTAISDKDGKFELRDIAPGAYALFAWEDAEPGAGLDPEFRRPFLQQATRLDVAAESRQSLHVTALSVR